MSTENEKLIAEARRSIDSQEHSSDALEQDIDTMRKLADALEAATKPVTGITEYAIRDDDTGKVVRWGDMNHLADADPKNYPGFTIVSSPAQVWTEVSNG